MFFREGDGEEDSVPSGIFESPFHKKHINLQRFHQFLFEKCEGAIEEAKAKTNFDLMENAIRNVANGRDIWDETVPLMEPHRDLFLQYFGALPSTSVWVERAVKKAKLCQKTGKGERNVTIYGIAGDDIDEMCLEQHVLTTYPGKMNRKRKKHQQEAASEDKQPRSENDYSEDIKRGTSLTRNIVNYSLTIHSRIIQEKQKIGEDNYNRYLMKTEQLLKSLPAQGSYVRYSEKLVDLEASRVKQHIPSAREKPRGVDETPYMKGEIPFGNLLKADNFPQIENECIARGIQLQDANGKKLNWTEMKNAIKKHSKEEWVAAHPGKEPPEDELKKYFKQQSNATFVIKQK